MIKSLSPQQRVGLFVFFILALLVYATVKISQSSLLPGSTYNLYVDLDSAQGLSEKTPVQIAGIHVGVVTDVSLMPDNKARIELEIDDDVTVSQNVQVRIKSVGFLGDTYVELFQVGAVTQPLKDGDVISEVRKFGDLGSVAGEFSGVGDDIKAITETLRKFMAGDDSSFAKTLTNVERISDVLKNVSVQNEKNLNAILSNLKTLSHNLNYLVQRNARGVTHTVDALEDITGQVKSGRGTIGKLVYDDETVNHINDSLESLNDLLGAANRLQVEMGYHTEYLGGTQDFKHYIELALKPRPDKYFLFEFIDDPAPDSKTVLKTSRITSGGVTTVVDEEIETTQTDKFLFSAQFAKDFYDFTLRGGIIESSGGVGLDYRKGPVKIKLSAFDLETDRGERPHIKAMGEVNLTKSLYLLGGVDDFLNNNQDLDWFMGAGVRITDDDLKSLFGLFSLSP